MTNPIGSVIRLMRRVLGHQFSGKSWATWWAALKAAHALSLTDEERATVQKLTGRQRLPSSPVRELWLLLGRRSGKSIIAALLAVWATCCRAYNLSPGEVGVYVVIAADRRQARVIKRYVSGLLRSHPALEALIERETKEAIWLTNGHCIEIHTCNWRTVRGYTCIGAACDEVAFWDSDDFSANPDREVLVALRASMASVPEAMLVGLTSVYARRGQTWRIYEKHFGKDDSDDVLVFNGPTRAFNPTISASIIESALEDDPIAASAEYLGEFRRDVETFLPLEALEAVRVPGRLELPPVADVVYHAFIDPAGGTGSDSMTLAIAHFDKERAVLDLVREQPPPFSPEQTVAEFSADMERYRIKRAVSDRYAAGWPVEQFQKFGITVEPSDKTRSNLYLEVLPMIASGRVEILDHGRLLKQFASLERRTSRQGKDSVNHPPQAGAHDDLCNAAAGALVLAARQPKYRSATWGRQAGTSKPESAMTPRDVMKSRLAFARHIERQQREVPIPIPVPTVTKPGQN